MDSYTWSSPGGAYKVPSSFQSRFLSEFPGYRIRWSLQKNCWLIEQKCGRGALPPTRIDAHNDSLIRARDGYWLVMEFQPGDRMACPIDGTTMSVSHFKSKESTCSTCRAAKRDGRIMAAYWPFDERLMEHLRKFDPLRGGIQRARMEADNLNQARLKEAERAGSDLVTSEAIEMHRQVVGIKQFGYNNSPHPKEDGMVTIEV